MAVTAFLMSEVLSKLWKEKLPVGERNIFAIAYHVAELACVLWFPCCLWNVSKYVEHLLRFKLFFNFTYLIIL